MKHLLATLVVTGGTLLAMSSAHAIGTAPLAAPGIATDSPLTLVSGGCGPAGFRDRFGYCRPRYAPPPRRFYGCRWGFHPTPYGCRPNY